MEEDLLRLINDFYYAHNYKKVVDLILQYEEIRGKLSPKLCLMLIIAYLKLGQKEEALKYKKIMHSMDSSAYFMLTEAIHYCKHYLFIEARDALFQCIEKGMNTALVYAHLGNVYYKLGDIKKAYYYIDIALKLNPDTVTTVIIKEIKDKLDKALNNSYIRTNYEYFKERGEELTSGMIVYLKDYAFAKSNVPYLIYKVRGNEVLGFSLSSIVIPEIYHLEPKNNVGKLDGYLTGNMIMFRTDEIENIVSEVNMMSLHNIWKMLVNYYSLKFYDKLNIYQKEFLNDLKSKLNINDVVVLAYKGIITRYLLFLGYDENNNYECLNLKVVEGLFTPCSDIIRHSSASLVGDVIKLSEPMQNKILAEANGELIRKRLNK